MDGAGSIGLGSARGSLAGGRRMRCPTAGSVSARASGAPAGVTAGGRGPMGGAAATLQPWWELADRSLVLLRRGCPASSRLRPGAATHHGGRRPATPERPAPVSCGGSAVGPIPRKRGALLQRSKPCRRRTTGRRARLVRRRVGRLPWAGASGEPPLRPPPANNARGGGRDLLRTAALRARRLPPSAKGGTR